MKVENVNIQIEYPDGYEFVRYGHANKGDFVLNSFAPLIHVVSRETSLNHFIFKKLT